MAIVICKRNNGYHWTEEKGCHFKGYLQTSEDVVLRDSKAVAFLSSINSYDAFQEALRNSYGFFSIIIEKENEIWVGVDIARSMPIYYSSDLQIISDDIDAVFQQSRGRNLELDDIRVLEMYATSFVAFQNTIFQDIKQIEIGCTARIQRNGIEQVPYYIHGSTHKNLAEDTIEEGLSKATDHMISRLLAVVNGRQIVLSLSGGYDSRYLACSLKKNGIDKVICYTYGRSDSYEVQQSKKVADALTYEWHNIEYDDKAVQTILEDGEKYLDYSNRPDYIAYLQNYLAVKHLHANHLIPEDSVFITGLCNDMPTGYYIPDIEKVKGFGNSVEGVARYNYENRFVKFDLTKKAQSIFMQDILDYLKRMSVEVNDYQSFIRALDCIETANFHSHCYLNMNTVHDFFGYEWLLPCWDRELLDFWYSLSAEDRIGQKTYEKYIVNYLGALYGVGTKKHINSSASTPLKQKIKRQVGAILVKIAYPLGIPMRRNTDINNMSVLEVNLYKKIEQKRAIKSDRAALILLLTIYMMERRYGTEWYDRIKTYIQ